MEFFCDENDKKHANIYLTKELDSYMCWIHLSGVDRQWHKDLQIHLERDKKREAFLKLPSQDLYIFDDIHMDPDFNPRQKKSDV